MESWMDELLSDSRAVVEQLLHEPLLSVDDLLAEVEAARESIAQASPVADKELGRSLADGASALLEAVRTDTAERKHLAQVAVRYFVLDDDGDEDLASAFGLDDDVEVFNAVVRALGHDQLAIDGYS